MTTTHSKAMTNEVSQAGEVRRLLREAEQQLRQSRSLLLGPQPSYAAGVSASVAVIRNALHAFTRWHSLPCPDDAPMRSLVRRAVPLASILRTPLRRAMPLEDLDTSLHAKDQFTIQEREAAQASYYTARNTFFTVLGALPATVRPTR